MICQECGVNEARVFFKQIVGSQVTQYLLCQDCAQKKGVATGPEAFSDLLAELGVLFSRRRAREPSGLKCPSCGIRYAQFLESGRLGCAACYESFREPLGDLLKRIHGSARHAGKAPPSGKTAAPAAAKASVDLKALRRRLKEAVAAERFEEAARLRDSIRGLEERS